MSQISNPMASTAAAGPAATSRLLSTFHVDGLYFGVEVLKVQELIRYQEMTRVPLAPGVIRGLINLRGQIVTAIDMRRRLDAPDRTHDQMPMNVVIRTGDGAVSLLVDEIGDVVEVQDEQFEPAPETIRGRSNDLVTGVYKLAERLLLALDVERAVSLERPGNSRTAA